MGLDTDKYEEKFGWISAFSIYSAMGKIDTSEEAKELLNNLKIELISIQKDIEDILK